MSNNRGMRWKFEDKKLLVECIIEKIKNNSVGFEPVVSAFYTSLKKNNSTLSLYNWTSMRDKMKNLKLKYKEAIDWRSKIGQGVMETSGVQSVKNHINKMCPLFDKLDEIFGHRANVNIEVIIDTESNYENIFNELEYNISNEENCDQANNLKNKSDDDLIEVSL